MSERFAVLALLALPACSPTLPSIPPHASVAPAVYEGPLEVCWVELARDTQPAGYGLAGESTEESWEVTFSGLLIRHPRGHLLLDAGQSSHFAEETGTSKLMAGLLLKAFQSGGTLVATAPEALRRIGEEPRQLAGVALSHIHGDHAGGIVDLPGTPVLLSAQELRFLKGEKDKGGFDVVRAHAEAAESRARAIEMSGAPYENFDESADYFKDGSVVFVPLFGHTPGSIGTFVNIKPSLRIFHVGDAVNTMEAVEKRRKKSVTLGLTDHDATQADVMAAKVGQLHAQKPLIRVLPAHDRKAWQGIFGEPGKCVGAGGGKAAAVAE